LIEKVFVKNDSEAAAKAKGVKWNLWKTDWELEFIKVGETIKIKWIKIR